MNTSNYTESSGPTPAPEFKGEFAHASGYKFSPKPVQQPGPPIWVGGHSGPAIRRAARFGDAWLPIGLRGTAGLEPDELKSKIQLLTSLTEKAGRDPASIQTCFSTDLGFDDGAASSERRTLSGSPEQIAQDIHRYAEVGVELLPFLLQVRFRDRGPRVHGAVRHRS